MVFLSRLIREKVNAKFLVIIFIVLFLLIIQGLFSLKYLGDLSVSSEEMYQQTNEGMIELNLLEDQLNKFETLYTLGLSIKNNESEVFKLKNLINETTANLGTLIRIYPDNQFIIQITDQVMMMIRALNDVQQQKFSQAVMNDMQLRNKQIRADLIAFKASKRLKGSLVMRYTEALTQDSRKKSIAIFVIAGVLICLMGFHSTKALSGNIPRDLRLANNPPQQSDNHLWLQELNEREREVLALLAQGYNNKEIADRIYVAEQTVKNYVSTIYSKIGVHDRVRVSKMATEAGINQLLNMLD